MPDDHLAELHSKLERDKAHREQQQQAAEERAKRRVVIQAQGQRFRDAFDAAYAWPGAARARGEKPSPQGFSAWADPWVELGKSLGLFAGVKQRLESAAASGVSELEYAARLLLLAMDGTQQQLAEALGKLHGDPGAQRCFLWLPYIRDCLWTEDGPCADLPEGITREDMEKAEAAFGPVAPERPQQAIGPECGSGSKAEEARNKAKDDDSEAESEQLVTLDKAAGESGRATAPELANRFGVPLPALTKALARFRHDHANGWHEVPSDARRPREARYIYDVQAVMPVVKALAKRVER